MHPHSVPLGRGGALALPRPSSFLRSSEPRASRAPRLTEQRARRADRRLGRRRGTRAISRRHAHRRRRADIRLRGRWRIVRPTGVTGRRAGRGRPPCHAAASGGHGADLRAVCTGGAPLAVDAHLEGRADQTADAAHAPRSPHQDADSDAHSALSNHRGRFFAFARPDLANFRLSDRGHCRSGGAERWSPSYGARAQEAAGAGQAAIGRGVSGTRRRDGSTRP